MKARYSLAGFVVIVILVVMGWSWAVDQFDLPDFEKWMLLLIIPAIFAFFIPRKT